MRLREWCSTEMPGFYLDDEVVVQTEDGAILGSIAGTSVIGITLLVDDAPQPKRFVPWTAVRWVVLDERRLPQEVAP
jgi:hypothetical protein